MNVPMKLLWKLLSINSIAILDVIVTIGLAVHLRAATYFTTLTNQYNIAPSDAHAMFLQAVDRYLLMASATGFVFASLLSLWLNFRLTHPITRITQAAKLIADGDYAQRVTTRGCSAAGSSIVDSNNLRVSKGPIPCKRCGFTMFDAIYCHATGINRPSCVFLAVLTQTDAVQTTFQASPIAWTQPTLKLTN